MRWMLSSYAPLLCLARCVTLMFLTFTHYPGIESELQGNYNTGEVKRDKTEAWASILLKATWFPYITTSFTIIGLITSFHLNVSSLTKPAHLYGYTHTNYVNYCVCVQFIILLIICINFVCTFYTTYYKNQMFYHKLYRHVESSKRGCGFTSTDRNKQTQI